MGHKGGCDPTATASGCGDRAWGRVKRKEEARSLSLAVAVYLPLIALIHLTKLTKNQEFPWVNQLYSKMGDREMRRGIQGWATSW
ncbi:MAG: hypothetical protein EAZ78_04255 [Oscillatoriales cyanobacterium]|nr:MAG: hypothetical protein EA000_00540 [Oscillatoriales cyanobacterium]TAD97898.1 MAG: hypothetical protein EAZ96_24755 [Oscillatoriales cyanobacterium]TAD99346.1 MAG: hypothetical protein EAZ98_04790 [Oscillatoriales cyanobacterium]TAF05848.1 MAG: hypothetical protein EAZ78_04255 [Oscillatoriales cyanobacterium]TAF37842.1 MAG: hypothetical protein EAZ68_13870 [Oscillatoriales cyanobacterium]